MTDPHVKVLAYSVDASWSDSPSRSSKLHAAADPSNEHSSAACSDRIPLNVDMGGFDPEEIRRELCQKPACQSRFFPEAAPLTVRKPERRAFPPGLMAAATADRLQTDRRARPRRRRDALDATLTKRDAERALEIYKDSIRFQSTSSLIEDLIGGDGSPESRTALRAEIDARIPPREQ